MLRLLTLPVGTLPDSMVPDGQGTQLAKCPTDGMADEHPVG
jgi:hypothetical protein